MEVLSEGISRHVHHILFVFEEIVDGSCPDVLPCVEVPVNWANVLHATLAVHEVEHILELGVVSASYAQSQPSGKKIIP